jgi:hypothetical protein
MSGQTALRKQLRVKIEKITPTSSGFNVLASVTNLGGQPVILAEADPLSGTLQSLDVQQWDEKLGWQSVGPCRDVGPISTVELKPNGTIQSIVPIGDTSHGWNSGICPRKIAHLGGKVRAILYYAYESQEQYRNRARDLSGDVKAVSTPVELPTAPR